MDGKRVKRAMDFYHNRAEINCYLPERYFCLSHSVGSSADDLIFYSAVSVMFSDTESLTHSCISCPFGTVLIYDTPYRRTGQLSW